jgi:hypothetical protein
MFNKVRFVTNTGCKRDDKIPSLINVEGRYVNSLKVYISGKFAGLVIVSKKYDSALNTKYCHQSFAFSKGEWKNLPLEKNSLAAAQAAFY